MKVGSAGLTWALAGNLAPPSVTALSTHCNLSSTLWSYWVDEKAELWKAYRVQGHSGVAADIELGSPKL